MNAKLFSLRKNVPRLHVPKGSVGIGNEQTGIYPQDSPGGWQIIGKTPIDLFSVKNNPPSLLLAGDKIKFYNISMDDFKELEGSRLVLKYKKS